MPKTALLSEHWNQRYSPLKSRFDSSAAILKKFGSPYRANQRVYEVAVFGTGTDFVLPLSADYFQDNTAKKIPENFRKLKSPEITRQGPPEPAEPKHGNSAVSGDRVVSC